MADRGPYWKEYYAARKEQQILKSRIYRASLTPEEKLARNRRRDRTSRNSAREYSQHHDRRERLAGRPRPEQCENPHCQKAWVGNSRSKKVVWDHDHATGAFRGWLCGHCNFVLGQANDNSSVLRWLADYLDSGGFGPGELSPNDPHYGKHVHSSRRLLQQAIELNL